MTGLSYHTHTAQGTASQARIALVSKRFRIRGSLRPALLLSDLEGDGQPLFDRGHGASLHFGGGVAVAGITGHRGLSPRTQGRIAAALRKELERMPAPT
jgi:hypothetical protein